MRTLAKAATIVTFILLAAPPHAEFISGKGLVQDKQIDNCATLTPGPCWAEHGTGCRRQQTRAFTVEPGYLRSDQLARLDLLRPVRHPTNAYSPSSQKIRALPHLLRPSFPRC